MNEDNQELASDLLSETQSIVSRLSTQMSFYLWFQVTVAIFITIFVVVPITQYWRRYCASLCKPVMFSYQHVLITGCGTGLGRSLVQGIFTRGAVVTMIGKDEQKLDQLKKELDVSTQVNLQPGLSSIPLLNYIVADISELKPTQIEKIIQDAELKYGPIEMVVCCAAVSKPAMFLSSEVSSYKHHMDLNFFGVLKFVHPIAKRMVIRRAGGRIAVIGDPTVVEKAIPGMGAYACSKGALEQLAYQLKAELEPYNIKVHYFLPCLMETPMLKQQREFYILPTKVLLGNKPTITPEEAALIFFQGLAMDHFIICGSWSIEFQSVLRARMNLLYCIFCAPLGLIKKKYDERIVARTMKQYQPFKPVAPAPATIS